MPSEPAETAQIIVTTETVDLPSGATTAMRCLLAAPAAKGRYPSIVCYSAIFQLTGPMRRACARLAGHGFVVLAPEIYGRIEAPGTVIPFDDAGRTRDPHDAVRTPVAHFDADGRLAPEHLARHPSVDPSRLGGVRFEHRIYPAEHAFMRDERPRYDPEATDVAFAASVQFLRAALAPG